MFEQTFQHCVLCAFLSELCATNYCNTKFTKIFAKYTKKTFNKYFAISIFP